MYLAAIADSQPPQTAPLSQVCPYHLCKLVHSSWNQGFIAHLKCLRALQYPSNLMMNPGARYMPPQSAQMMSPQPMMGARSPMMYAHPSLSPLQQQQQQQASAHGQLGMTSSGTTSGFNILHGEASMGGGGGNSMMNTGMFSGFGRSGSGTKEGSTSLSVDIRGGGGGANSGAQSGDGEYLKAGGTEEEGS
jgi:hypothetical protein